MTLLSVENLTVMRGTCPVVQDITLSIAVGECVGLIGPNGAGKTTLMRATLGLLPHQGVSSLSQMTPKLRARACAWMPQSREIAWPVSVETLVALGRIPHLPRGHRLPPHDQEAVDAALDKMDLSDFRDRQATALSGGEQARVLIARTLAQQTPLLVADEPTAGLDPAGQIATMKVFSSLAQDNRAVLVSLHDLGLAARHCTRLVLINNGRVMADGEPMAVLSPDNMRRAFGVSAHLAQTPDGPVFQALEVL